MSIPKLLELRIAGEGEEAPRREGRRALMLAACHGLPGVVAALLHAPGSSCCGFEDRAAALMVAAARQARQCMQVLLSGGDAAELVLARDVHGGNALSLAVLGGSPACDELLLQTEPAAQLAATDAWGWTPLLQAADSGYAACMELLLRHSPAALVTAADNSGAS